MTDLEKLKEIKASLEQQCMLAIRSTSVIEDRLDIEKTYRSQIQTFENAVSALEKQIPRKVEILTYQPLINSGWEHRCPNCGCAVGKNNNLGFAYEEHLEPYEVYCSQCGQALDWKEIV